MTAALKRSDDIVVSATLSSRHRWAPRRLITEAFVGPDARLRESSGFIGDPSYRVPAVSPLTSTPSQRSYANNSVFRLTGSPIRSVRCIGRHRRARRTAKLWSVFVAIRDDGESC
jgi:hypothetical protein